MLSPEAWNLGQADADADAGTLTQAGTDHMGADRARKGDRGPRTLAFVVVRDRNIRRHPPAAGVDAWVDQQPTETHARFAWVSFESGNSIGGCRSRKGRVRPRPNLHRSGSTTTRMLVYYYLVVYIVSFHGKLARDARWCRWWRPPADRRREVAGRQAQNVI